MGGCLSVDGDPQAAASVARSPSAPVSVRPSSGAKVGVQCCVCGKSAPKRKQTVGELLGRELPLWTDWQGKTYCRDCFKHMVEDRQEYEEQRSVFKRMKAALYPRRAPSLTLHRIPSDLEWKGTTSFTDTKNLHQDIAKLAERIGQTQIELHRQLMEYAGEASRHGRRRRRVKEARRVERRRDVLGASSAPASICDELESVDSWGSFGSLESEACGDRDGEGEGAGAGAEGGGAERGLPSSALSAVNVARHDAELREEENDDDDLDEFGRFADLLDGEASSASEGRRPDRAGARGGAEARAWEAQASPDALEGLAAELSSASHALQSPDGSVSKHARSRSTGALAALAKTQRAGANEAATAAAAKEAAAKEAAAKEAAAKGAAPKEATPKSATPKGAAPKGAAPKSAAPKSATPKGAAPKSATPKSATPKSATPKGATPKGATPKSATPKEVTPVTAKARGAASSGAAAKAKGGSAAGPLGTIRTVARGASSAAASSAAASSAAASSAAASSAAARPASSRSSARVATPSSALPSAATTPRSLGQLRTASDPTLSDVGAGAAGTDTATGVRRSSVHRPTRGAVNIAKLSKAPFARDFGAVGAAPVPWAARAASAALSAAGKRTPGPLPSLDEAVKA